MTDNDRRPVVVAWDDMFDVAKLVAAVVVLRRPGSARSSPIGQPQSGSSLLASQIWKTAERSRSCAPQKMCARCHGHPSTSTQLPLPNCSEPTQFHATGSMLAASRVIDRFWVSWNHLRTSLGSSGPRLAPLGLWALIIETYGMARPFRPAALDCPGAEREERNMQIAVLGIDLQELLQPGGSGQHRARDRAQTLAPGQRHQVLGRPGPMPCGDGGPLWCSPPRRHPVRPGPPGSADVARGCSPLRQGPEERQPRRGSDRRGSHTADHALRRADERGAVHEPRTRASLAAVLRRRKARRVFGGLLGGGCGDAQPA